MSNLRAGYRFGLFGRSMLWAAVLVLSCSLILMGGLIWINNTWAVIPDNDPATSFEISIIVDELDGQDDISALDTDGDGQIPVPGGTLLKGNGDRDDNRPEPPIIASQTVVMVTPNSSNASLVIWENRTIKSYLDFGHLKTFSDASVYHTSENRNSFGNKAAALYSRGGLFHCMEGCK